MINVIEKQKYIKAAVVASALLRELPVPKLEEHFINGKDRKVGRVQFTEDLHLFVDLEDATLYMLHDPETATEEEVQASFDYVMAFAAVCFASYGVDHNIQLYELNDEYYFPMRGEWVDRDYDALESEIRGEAVKEYLFKNAEQVLNAIIKAMPFLLGMGFRPGE